MPKPFQEDLINTWYKAGEEKWPEAFIKRLELHRITNFRMYERNEMERVNNLDNYVKKVNTKEIKITARKNAINEFYADKNEETKEDLSKEAFGLRKLRREIYT